MIPGHATTNATKELAEKMGPKQGYTSAAYRNLGRTGLTTSEIGFGCYRIDDEIAEHHAALAEALSQGCNLIDTSTNYADGGSEICVGKVLQGSIAQGDSKREQLIVVSKAGYLQGQNLALAQKLEQERSGFSDIVKYMDGCWHCISPEFLADQIGRSLQRLGIETIDVFLLHNPEYFFADAIHRHSSQPLPELRQEFYRRIQKAFAHLEEEVANGRIRFYGVSSNTFGAQASDPEATSLTDMWNIAVELGQRRSGNPQDHHFAVVQLPANLFEPDVVLNQNNGSELNKTVIDFAEEQGLGILINRPLNAILNGTLVRLADFNLSLDMGADSKTLVLAASQAELEFEKTLATHLPRDFSAGAPNQLFRWGSELSRTALESFGLEQWRQVQIQYIVPQIKFVVSRLDQFFQHNQTEAWLAWREKYLNDMNLLLAAIEIECTQRSQAVSNHIAERLNPLFPPDLRSLPLSQKSLAILTNIPGVSCVLNGMRTVGYVQDSMTVMKIPSFAVERSVFETFRGEN